VQVLHGAGHQLAEAFVFGLFQARDDFVGQVVFGELAHGVLLDFRSVLSKAA
jgi:hypothetical protein